MLAVTTETLWKLQSLIQRAQYGPSFHLPFCIHISQNTDLHVEGEREERGTLVPQPSAHSHTAPCSRQKGWCGRHGPNIHPQPGLYLDHYVHDTESQTSAHFPSSFDAECFKVASEPSLFLYPELPTPSLSHSKCLLK